MPPLPLSLSSDDRTDFGLPVPRLVNMFVEAIGEGPSKDGRFQRYGSSLFATVATGSTLGAGLFYDPGTFDLIFMLRNNTLYGVTPETAAVANLGALSSLGLVRSASSPTQRAFIATDGSLHVYGVYPAGGTGSPVLTPVTTFSDGTTALPAFSDVCYLADRFVYSVAGSAQLYFSALGDATIIDPTMYGYANSRPGVVVGLATLGDEFAVFCSSHIEWWQTQTDPNNPYARAIGRNYERGCVGKGTIVPLDNSLFWVGDDLVVYRTGLVPIRVSTHGVEEQFRDGALSNMQLALAWGQLQTGHAVYVLTQGAISTGPPIQTFAFDVATKQWSDWSTGFSVFGGAFNFEGVYVNGVNYIAEVDSGLLLSMGAADLTDNGTAFSRVVSAFWPQPAGSIRCDNASLLCRTGLAGAGVTPNAQMRYSDDNGATWSSWLESSLGTTGQSPLRISWRRLGRINPPGRAFEFMCQDAAPFVVEAATINEFRP